MGSFRHILRRLRRSPMFTGITLLTLAVGIGANSAIFSVVYGVLLKPLPYPDPDRLVAVWQTAPGLNIKELNASPSTYFLYREEGQAFQDIGIWQRNSESITGVGEPEQVRSLNVTDGVLPILGVQPIQGRWFSRKDDSPGSPDTAILTYAYWQRRFGGDPATVGKAILVNGKPHEVIGIMPESFRFMSLQPEIIRPMRFNRNDAIVGNFSFQAVARLKPGVTLAQANADVARMIPMLTQKFRPAPGMNLKMMEEVRMGPSVRPFQQDVVGDVGKVLWVLMAMVGIVLFIACANVANLLLVRAEGRQQELSVRAALGASWSQIARDLLLESAMLGIAGGIFGLGIAYAALRLLVFLSPAQFPRLSEIGINLPVLLFTLAISVAAGILFGLIPVFKYASPRVATGLRAGGRTMSEGRERHRTRSTLVVVQVALALVLLISSGLMIRTLVALKHVDPGFKQPDEIFTLRIFIPEAQVKEPDRVVRMHNDIRDKIAAIPGVQSVGMVNSITMDGGNNNDPIYAEDRVYAESQIPPLRRWKHLSPGVFATMGNPLLAGRDLTWADIYEKRPVVLVSENLARELWKSPAAAIGKRVRENLKGTWREVVGVVGNEYDNGVDQKPTTIVYWPFMVENVWGNPIGIRRTLAYAIRTPRAGSPGFLKEVQQAVWSVNSSLPLFDVRTVREIYDRSMARTSFTLVTLSIAAGMALLLGLVGIYGVISYSVSQRTREIGIRMALGAQHSAVRGLFVRHGLLLAGIGVVCGLAAAIPLSRFMSALLFEVKPVDPVTYVGVSVVLAAAALLATYLPARRATAIDPSEALRTE